MFLIALTLLTAAEPDRWIHVGGTADQFQEYLDKESINRSGDKVTLWTRRDLARDEGTTWNEVEFDCSKQTETILAHVRNERGTISHNIDRPHRAAAPIAPRSIEEKAFNLVCR